MKGNPPHTHTDSFSTLKHVKTSCDFYLNHFNSFNLIYIKTFENMCIMLDFSITESRKSYGLKFKFQD